MRIDGDMGWKACDNNQHWQRLLYCAYTTQLLHSTVEVCWNNDISHFILDKLCAESLDKYLPRSLGSGPVWGLEYTSNSSWLAPLWEPH